jgi:hypothetical protein
MKSAIIAIMALGFSTVAFADGFVCETNDGVYTIKAYNHTQASEGTRNGAIMIVSDNTIQAGRKTIATFEATDLLLSNDGARYVADVDLRFNNSGRQGENFLGTKLGQIDTVTLDVDFSYGAPKKAGAEVSGEITVAKRNGKSISADVTCTRYLKN